MSKKKSILYIHLNLSISLLATYILFVTTVQWARPVYVRNRCVYSHVSLYQEWNHNYCFTSCIPPRVLGFVCGCHCSSPLLSPLFLLLDAGWRNHALSYGGEGVWDSIREVVLVHLPRMGWESLEAMYIVWKEINTSLLSRFTCSHSDHLKWSVRRWIWDIHS